MTDVIDMDSGHKLRGVLRIDKDAGEVVCAYQPYRMKIDGSDDVDTYTLRFRSIYPIYAGAPRPYLVHCYGRMA